MTVMWSLDVVVASVRALMQSIAKGLGNITRQWLCVLARIVEVLQVVAALADTAYTHTDLVERCSEFAAHGFILDVFPPTAEHSRCESSSRATRSRQSGGSRFPSSAASRSSSTVCGHRSVGNCCSPMTFVNEPPCLPDSCPVSRTCCSKLPKV